MNHSPLVVTYANLPALKFAATKADDRSLIIWLHGIGERGTDPSIIANYGLPAALAAGRAVSTCDVLCPQIPLGMEWSSAMVRSIVLHSRASYDLVVLIGYSLGGVGVLDSVADYGATCSLHVSIASGEPRSPTASQVDSHVLAIQGEHDLQPEVTRFIAHVRRLGATAEEAIVEGGDHYISESALWHPKLQAALSARGIGLHGRAALYLSEASKKE